MSELKPLTRVEELLDALLNGKTSNIKPLSRVEAYLKALVEKGMGGGSGAVSSVNGKTGAVNLSASDVGALPDTYTPPDQTAEQVGADPKGTAESKVSAHNTDTTSHNDLRLELKALTSAIPTKVSQLDNDKGYLTEHQDISGKADKKGLTLGIHTDGLVYLFVDGAPVGTGVELTAGDIYGYVDADNNIVLMGALAGGTYSIKYEMEDGSTVDIGDLVLDNNVYYSVTNNLTNCTSDNSATQAIGGESYSATISANDGYELSSVVVTMGGTDISASVVSGGAISIAEVTGDIVITAVAVEVGVDTTYMITNKLVACTSSNDAASVSAGESYSAAITADSGFNLSAVYVTMGGNPVTVNGNNIDIASVTGDVVISCVGYEPDKRLNSSGEKTEAGCELTGFIPCTYNDTICMKGVTATATTATLGFYSSATTGMDDRLVISHTMVCFTGSTGATVNGEVVSCKISEVNNDILVANKDALAFVRITGNEINADSIITVNEPIM